MEKTGKMICANSKEKLKRSREMGEHELCLITILWGIYLLKCPIISAVKIKGFNFSDERIPEQNPKSFMVKL